MRLTDSPEFERVYRQGTAYRGRLFSVHAFPNEHGTPRLGLSISRKVGNAVTRNAVRRRLREVFYSCVSELSGNLDLVVSAKPAAAEATFEELREEFGKSFDRSGPCLRRRRAWDLFDSTAGTSLPCYPRLADLRRAAPFTRCRP
jgi:ribonuclease P protein component